MTKTYDDPPGGLAATDEVYVYRGGILYSVYPASIVISNATIAAWFAALPTTLPAATGQPWNNGGLLAFS